MTSISKCRGGVFVHPYLVRLSVPLESLLWSDEIMFPIGSFHEAHYAHYPRTAVSDLAEIVVASLGPSQTKGLAEARFGLRCQ